MVDVADVPKIMALTGEARNLDRTISLLNADGRIVSMTIGGREGSIMLSTVGWDYPPQMATTILERCQTRREEIDGELAAAGVTGVDRERAEPARRS